ncbi:MAG: 30S ribosomal protein S4 [Luteitalea sp.]|nr:30S ribosomal protein S4 [Luteitalea sp.]
MARLRGPRVKVMRALGTELPGLSRKSIEKRPYPPGEHGPKRRRRNVSDYGLRLREKQKMRFNYCISESQLRRLVEAATRRKGNTGVKLIELLERRLDNVLFRAGLARTIPAARQLVGHGHIFVNARKVDRPSFSVTRGDVVSVRPASRDIALRALESGAGLDTPWLVIDKEAPTINVASYPDESFVPFDLEPRLIVEHYSRAM